MGTNTGIGIGIGIPFKNNALGGDRPYLPPELKAKLIGVWDNYGKKNTDADRNIIKNKIPNAGGDLEILNAAYEGMSGYNGYPVIFGINKTWKKLPTYNSIYNINDNKIHFTKILFTNKGLIFSSVKQNDQLYDITEIPSFKIRVSGLKGDSKLRYSYIKTENAVYQSLLDLDNGIHELPKSLAPTNSISNNSWIGFTISPRIENETSFDCDITIEILPEYEGAFVTDGVNDMIVSQNPVSEMLDGSKELTVVSMIHQITGNENYTNGYTNCIRHSGGFIRNFVAGKDGKGLNKTGIYGYTSTQLDSSNMGLGNVINNILGDKEDYAFERSSTYILDDAKYSVQNFINGEGNVSNEGSQVAWYWTFIAKRVLTTDEINQVIAYFNLDKYVKPDIYYDVKKQGLTNDTPDEDWYLKDFSGNGRDMTLYNYAKTPESGINEEGGLQSDGVNDFGQFVGNLGLKDYTVVADRAYPIVTVPQFSVISDATGENANTPFLLEHINEGEFAYSYLANTAISINKEREICYQSTYQYKDTAINRGSSTSLGTGLTIARYGINNGYSALALYSFMLFHYSMSKFLIERQLKKHKLGTLYPNMVEFRPIIKSNIDIKNIVYLDKDSNVVKVGDYISIGSNIKTSITVLDGYKISKVSSTAFNNITIEKSNTDFIYDVIFYGIKKSPQKINLVIEQDSDYVQWNPNIKANVSRYSVTANIRETDGTTLKLVNRQFYSTSIIGNLILDIVPPYKDSDEVTNVVIDGKSYTPTKDSSGNYYRLEIPLVFPKKINITIQEYVRYEDIVQPYPVLLRFKDENNNEISWGDKIKLGSNITRIGSFNDCNLLKGIYTVSNAKLNGNSLPSTSHVVERQMVFTCTATWIFDDNEPNCILSPRILRIPNSSYKILGYIPDISGHGNHGVIHNSAYAGMSGVNGYPYDYKNGFMTYSNCRLVDSEIFNVISISPTVNIIKNTPTYKGKIKVTGLSGYLKLRIYPKDDSTNAIEILEDGVYDINIDNETGSIYFHVVKTKEGSNDISVIIQQVGEYEGAFYLDGVDDFITIPTLVTKQSLIKCNWTAQNYNKFLVDYRKDNASNGYSTNKTGSTDKQLAYNGRVTYIDGILNKHITPDDLKEITHNIIVQYPNNIKSETTIACAYDLRNHMTMALWDYISFPEISTETKIKELNTYIGITPKVTLPNYYWDNYGKKNTDANRGYIDEQVSLQKTGTSVNPLENFNISYEGMSGYNGYPVVFGANKTWANKAPEGTNSYIYTINDNKYNFTQIYTVAAWAYSYIKQNGELTDYNKDVTSFKIKVTGLEPDKFLIKYNYLSSTDATVTSGFVINSDGIYELPKSFANDGSLIDNYGWVGFGFAKRSTDIPNTITGVNITIEILPEYENGLAYDGVSDFTDNKNIPIFTDFTAIIKRVDLDAKNDNSTVIFKGNKIYESGIGNGFILDYCYNSKNYVYSYGKLNQIERDDSKIIYLTPESYNGNPIIKGENEDNLGLVLGKYWKGIIYKTILYSKTISLLEINFLKNLMEKDEIIDINHPIFISNTEDENNASQDT